jgi:hypothetical protein
MLRKTAHTYVAKISRAALSAIEKGYEVGRRREVVPKVADVVLERESVGHRVTVFLVFCDKGVRGVVEAKH